MTAEPSTRISGRARRNKKIALSAAILVLMAAVATIGSWAAWTASDSNPNNTFSTNTVLLSDNQGGEGGSATSTGTAIFNVTNLEPGSAATTGCIGVDISGTAPVSSLTLGATLGGSGLSTLEGQLTMTTATLNTSGTVSVTPGTNTNNGSCTNYPSGGTNTAIGTSGATLQNWASGGPYTISGPVTNTWYKFTVSGLPSADTACATYCNQKITVTLTWTLTST